jgi:ABC-type transporter MlaC component
MNKYIRSGLWGIIFAVSAIKWCDQNSWAKSGNSEKKSSDEKSDTSGVKQAENLIAEISKKVLEIMQSSSSDSEKKQHLQEVLKNNFNIKVAAKHALKSYWEKMKKEEQDDYLVLFEKDIVKTYFDILKKYYEKELLKIVKSLAVPKKDNAFYVYSEARNPDTGAPIEIKWAIKNGKILDATIGRAISVSDAKRKEYAEVIRSNKKNDGSISFQDFIQYLKERVK